MPKRHFIDRFVRDMRAWHEKLVDHMHFTIPLKTHPVAYNFPSEYIGQYGVYEAVKHIYQKNSHLAHLISDDDNSLHVSKRYFATELEKGIDKIRQDWRDANNLGDDSTVIFVAPGNEKVEAEFCIENARRGIKEFLLKYSAPTSMSAKALPLENFVTVISLHKDSDAEKYVR